MVQIQPKEMWHEYLNSLNFSHIMGHELTLLTALQRSPSLCPVCPVFCLSQKCCQVIPIFLLSLGITFMLWIFSFMRQAETTKCISQGPRHRVAGNHSGQLFTDRLQINKLLRNICFVIVLVKQLHTIFLKKIQTEFARECHCIQKVGLIGNGVTKNNS